MIILGAIVLSFFAVIGVLCFIGACVRNLSSEGNSAVLILKNVSGSDAEMRVRKAASVCEHIRCEQLLCECTDDEAVMICEVLQRYYPVIRYRRTE